VLAACGEGYSLVNAAFVLAKGGIQPLDLAAVQCSETTPRISFLALSWGLISDIDIDSEKLRCCGGLRFTIYAIYRCLFPRIYQGAIWYWPPEQGCPPPPPAIQETLPEIHKWKCIEGDFALVWACNTAYQAADVAAAPGAMLSDGLWHILVVRRASRFQLARILMGIESGTHIGIAGSELIPCRALRLVPERHSARRDGYLSLDGELMPFGPIQVWAAAYQGYVLGS